MRSETIAVQIGEVVLSSEQPVLVQSMLNTSTLDTEACVEQSIRSIEAGGQLVRITAPGVKEAENLKNMFSVPQTQGGIWQYTYANGMCIFLVSPIFISCLLYTSSDREGEAL